MNKLTHLLFSLLFLTACGEDDPMANPDAARIDASPADAGADAVVVDANPACQPGETDYRPGADDGWPACISDDDAYHPFDTNISTIARVAGFESISDLLFEEAEPSPQDFIDARLIYVEDNGLESRVTRREDEHYAPAPDACGNLTPEQQAEHPDRCVGPVRIQPIINDAFTAGASGTDPRINAARIEAALLWFLYVSVHKEATTCTAKVADCDSHYAYYTGGEPRSGGLGLARYVRGFEPVTHDRVWDGILAVRCWRDLDNPTGTATDLELRDRAIAQLDRALLRGVALIVRDRAVRLESATGTAREAHWAFLQILGPVLDREATERSASLAAELRAELAKEDPATANVEVITGAIDEIFPCP